MERSVARMTSEEREDMLMKILKAKKDNAWYLYKDAEKDGREIEAERYWGQASAVDQIIDMLTNDDDLLDYARIWGVDDEN